MQYYSDKTKRLYTSVEELKTAEKEFDAKQKGIELAKKERSEVAKRVKYARQLADQAQRTYEELLRDFIKKYGSYHTTVTETKRIEHNPSKILLDLLDNWPILF
mgnify:CR=1 FL=1